VAADIAGREAGCFRRRTRRNLPRNIASIDAPAPRTHLLAQRVGWRASLCFSRGSCTRERGIHRADTAAGAISHDAPAAAPRDRIVTRSWRWLLAGIAALALLGLVGRLAATGSSFGCGSVLRRNFQTSCVEGCQGVGAPHASCRSVCACIVEEMAVGKTPEELDRLIVTLEEQHGAPSPELDAVAASRQRCVARLSSP